jgi:hypothetical protein
MVPPAWGELAGLVRDQGSGEQSVPVLVERECREGVLQREATETSGSVC